MTKTTTPADLNAPVTDADERPNEIEFTGKPSPIGKLNACRSQAESEDEREMWGDRTAVQITDAPITRQEFKQETDVNHILKKFGVGGLPMKNTVYGEQNFDLDLQGAMEVTRDAQQLFDKLDPKVKELFPDWKAMLNGMASGELPAYIAQLQQEERDRSAEREAARKRKEDARKETPAVNPPE